MISKIKLALFAIAKKVVVQKLSAYLGAGSAALFALAITTENYLTQYMPLPPQIWEVRLFAALLSLLFVCLALYFWFKPKLVVSQKDGGCWLDEKIMVRYCVSCKTIHKQLVPLTQTSDSWRCNVKGCYACYFLPNLEAPKTDKIINEPNRRIYG